jgi:hypothetical protein
MAIAMAMQRSGDGAALGLWFDLNMRWHTVCQPWLVRAWTRELAEPRKRSPV